MEENKRTMIAALKSVCLRHGYPISPDFEGQAAKLSLRELAIEISLVQVGI
ncbi:TPA: hypothetical protein U1B89_000785 [Streptococcus suis]|nr:hypothetical protein [Streptococcus suis]